MRTLLRSPIFLAAALLGLAAGCGSSAPAPEGTTPVEEGADAAVPQRRDAREPPTVVDAAPPPDSAPAMDAAVADSSSPTDLGGGPDVADDVAGSAPDAAPDAPPIVGRCPAGLGRPTPAEIKMVSDRMKANPYVPSGTNQGNNLAYGNVAKQVSQLKTMFGMTNDVYFLDQMIVFADHMLSVRNDKGSEPRMIWTGAVEPCWPNKATTDPDAAYCGTENGLVLDHIAGVAKAIFDNRALWNQRVGVPDPHGFGATYLARGRTYLTEVSRTLDSFLIAHYVQRNNNNRLYNPTDAGFAALGLPYMKSSGHAVPWNQQDMITGALSTVGQALTSLGEEPARVASNDEITKAAITWFTGELAANQYTANGKPVYKWGYSPGDLRHVENLAHASADINMLYKAYKRGVFGVTSMNMVTMANTFLEVIVKPGGAYAVNVDGTGGERASVSDAWMKYEEFRPGIAAILHPKVSTVDASTDIPTAISILSLRQSLCK